MRANRTNDSLERRLARYGGVSIRRSHRCVDAHVEGRGGEAIIPDHSLHPQPARLPPRQNSFPFPPRRVWLSTRTCHARGQEDRFHGLLSSPSIGCTVVLFSGPYFFQHMCDQYVLAKPRVRARACTTPATCVRHERVVRGVLVVAFVPRTKEWGAVDASSAGAPESVSFPPSYPSITCCFPSAVTFQPAS